MPFTTGILDNFNRANENPLSGGGNWVARRDSGTVKPMQLVSNQAANQTAFEQDFAAYQAAGPFTDCEAYITLATVGTDRVGVFARIQGSTSTVDMQGFAAEFNSGSGVRLRGFNTGGASTAWGSASWTPSAGDKLGITCQGGTIKVWTYHSGVWTEQISQDQSGMGSPYSTWTGGYLGIGARAGDVRIDDFGGGVYVTAITPVADFTATPLTGVRPLSVAFTDTSTNTPTSWAWTFGDGGTSTSQNPTHSYTTAGTYTVTLQATNAAGSNTKTRTAYVTVANPSGTMTKIKWGDHLQVTDEGGGVIRIDYVP